MTAKELLMQRADDWTEEQALAALRAVEAHDASASTEMAPLPDGWGQTLTGEPMPNIVASVRRSRAER
jgi:hypothetical protein